MKADRTVSMDELAAQAVPMRLERAARRGPLVLSLALAAYALLLAALGAVAAFVPEMAVPAILLGTVFFVALLVTLARLVALLREPPPLAEALEDGFLEEEEAAEFLEPPERADAALPAPHSFDRRP